MTLTLTNLATERLENPLGIETPHPHFSWILQSDLRGTLQSAYQVLAASSADRLAPGTADLWDSGRVASDQSAYVGYAGRALESRQRVAWKVLVWDQAGQESAWSEPAWFEMALLTPADWQAGWISAPGTSVTAPYLRKTFHLPGATVRGQREAKAVRAARLYAVGLGYSELSINGARVGDRVLDPAFTRYDRTVLYSTYDVTGLLTGGENAVGCVLGNGFYNQTMNDAWYLNKSPWRAEPCLLFQLEIELAGGQRMVVTGGPDWKVSDGPIRENATRAGETYDARRELPGWDRPGFDDSAWAAAVPVNGPAGELHAQAQPPIRVMQTLAPAAITEPEPGVYLVDMGQGFSGWVTARLFGAAGTAVTFRYGEILDAKGCLDTNQIKSLVYEGEVQTDHYILKGKGEEVYEPHFAYHGFRYVEVTGCPGRLTLDAVRGRVVYTGFENGGSFTSSNDLLNRIQNATTWSYTSNFTGYPSDCPHREKNGWTGDAHLAAEAGLYNFQSENAYIKWLRDIRDAQKPAGELPGIVPTSGWGYEWGCGPCWDSAYILIPWYLYLYKGDAQVLAEHYPGMKLYVDYTTSRSPAGLASFGLGDWVPPYGNPEDYTAPLAVLATAYYYLDVTLMARVAGILGKPQDAAAFKRLAGTIKTAFNRRFYDPVSGLYAGGSQTALSAALYSGLVEPRQVSKVARQLVAEIRQQKWRINAGIHGTKFILNGLSAAGWSSAAYRLAVQRRYPSWGYMIDQGATTLWEEWNGGSSRMHIMFGDISAWFYKNLAGLQPDPDQPGFKHALIRPWLAPGLDWVKVEHRSIYGLFRVEWARHEKHLVLSVTVPANATAELSLPALDPARVTESGPPGLSGTAGAVFLRFEDDRAVYTLGSGDYSFESPI